MLCSLFLGLLAATAFETPLPQPGDIVFIGDSGGWADIGAQLSDKDKRYGHVGIAVEEDGAMMIVHASGAPATGGTVTTTPYSVFIGHSGQVGIYRTDEEWLTATITEKAAQAATDALPFDDAFSLKTADAVYCTELIWRVLSEVIGKDAVPQKSKILGQDAITLEDLQLSPHLRPVRQFEKKAAP
ncbi:MAG: YiiX/YebB-like N1pC/P60 family cysteine hydrolase [Parvularcula sp.]